MALTQIELIRLIVGDTPSNPFYPVFTDDQYQALIDAYGPSQQNIIRWVAGAISMTIAGYNTHETTGDISVRNEYAKNYLAALKSLISDSGTASIPNGAMPYAAGISWADVKANNNNSDNVRSPLSLVKVCDEEGLFFADPFNCECSNA